MLPERLKLTVIKRSGKQFNAGKSWLNRSDIKEIIIAMDTDREGELVARWIIAKAYENLYHAAAARSEADWYIGLNATRALTTRSNAQLNCGR